MHLTLAQLRLIDKQQKPFVQRSMKAMEAVKHPAHICRPYRRSIFLFCFVIIFKYVCFYYFFGGSITFIIMKILQYLLLFFLIISVPV